MSEPEVRRTLVSNYCSLGPRPQLMTGYLVEWLRQRFGSPDNIEEAALRSLLWEAMPKNTCQEIVIEAETKLNFGAAGKRPALMVRRGDWTSERIGIDDRLLGGNNLDGVRHYCDFVRGTHTVFCLTTVATQTELLAAEVYRNLKQFGPRIREEVDLARFGAVGMGSVFEVEEARKTFAVPVTVAYSAFENWEIREQAPVWKTFELAANLP